MTNGASIPLRESDLIFSSASSQLKEALGQLKKHNLSIKNRLRSIKQDSEFASSVSDAYNLPLVANERCGSWYISPERKAGSAYFKSTDGHFGQWSFSLRRLNFQVLDVVGKHGGCVMVDSTRRGKSMPDALSKTVPIWVCVLDRLLFPEHGEAGKLRTPSDVVGDSEHTQIEARLQGFDGGVRGLGLDLKELREKLKGKPMDVVWQRPGDELPAEESRDLSRKHLIVLCTASNQTSNETSATSDYVQGAADDPESWSWGLDAATFWRHQRELLHTPEDKLPDRITALMAEARSRRLMRSITLIRPGNTLHIGTNEAVLDEYSDFDIIISCTATPLLEISKAKKHHYIALPTPAGKAGSRILRNELHRVDAIQPLLFSQPSAKIMITCGTGKDLSVGVTLALLCKYFDESGSPEGSSPDGSSSINKAVIKQRLSWIMVSMPDASPSRATLQSVNAFLMG